MVKRLIQPFVGVDEFKLLSSEETILDILRKKQMEFSKEIWDNEECTVKVPWVIVRTADHLSFFFAKNRLFKIFIDGGNDSELPNGIHIGMPIAEAQSIDKSLEFDEWNEDWSSKEGYWIEDGIDDGLISSITIFIKELLDEDSFEKYEW